MKIESVNRAKSTNKVEIMAMDRSKNGLKSMIPISVEADTGANITLLKAEILQDLNWVQMSATDMHIEGNNAVADPCLGKAYSRLQRGN